MRSSHQIQQLAPILQALRSPNPDWQAIAKQLLAYASLPDWATAVQGTADWKGLAQSILLHLGKTDAHYQRAIAVIDLLGEQPQDLDTLADASTYSRSTVQQTLLALKKGQYEILEEMSGDVAGSQVKAFFVNN